MKTTKWYRTGEPLPDSATYLQTKNRVTGSHEEFDGTCIDDYAEFHLYEIPVDSVECSELSDSWLGEVERRARAAKESDPSGTWSVRFLAQTNKPMADFIETASPDTMLLLIANIRKLRCPT